MEEEEERRWHRWWPEGERLLFRPGVPTLAELCLDYVAESFQQLEGLGEFPGQFFLATLFLRFLFEIEKCYVLL